MNALQDNELKVYELDLATDLLVCRQIGTALVDYWGKLPKP